MSDFAANNDTKPRRLAIGSPYLHRMQRRHFVLFNVLPTLGAIAGLVLVWFHPIGWLEIGLFLGMWLITGLGISAGYHRHFTHRSFKTTTPVQVLLVIMGSMAALGPVISWVAMHRRHHQFADQPGDMHSPNLHGEHFTERVRGFIHAHLTWMIRHEYPNVVHYAPDLLGTTAIVRVSGRYHWWVLLGLAIPTVIGGAVTASWMGALQGFLWGGAVRMFVVANLIATLNSVLHTMGSQPYSIKDNSRNSWFLGTLIWGEGWHHNHHAFPSSAWFGLRWYRVDLSYYFIRLLAVLGLAWDVKVPTKRQLASASPADSPAIDAGHNHIVKATTEGQAPNEYS